MGDWSSGTVYTAGEAVYYNGSSYVELNPDNSAHKTTTPPTDIADAYGNWALLAAQGEQGPQGPTGPVGGVSSISTGTIANTATAGAGTASIGGSSANPVLNVNFPADVQSVTAGTVTTGGTTGTLTIGGPATNPQINVNFPASSGGVSIYGDGSDGTTTGVCAITSNTNWTTTPPSAGIQCMNFSISSGVTLHVPSGTVIRATGTVTISGTLMVDPGAAQGLYSIAVTANGNAYGGVALSASIQRRLTNPGIFGGGNGGANNVIVQNYGVGGGSLSIFAAGALTIEPGALISANGGNGGHETAGYADGGGAGGIILLASKTLIYNAGTVSANGGNGAPSGSTPGGPVDSGGGGGGGIIHFFAPSGQLTKGTAYVNGGATSGSTSGTGFSFGGGACGGNGGNGSSTSSGLTVTSGTAGNVFTTTAADPATLLLP
jgi:hypothetical protein